MYQIRLIYYYMFNNMVGILILYKMSVILFRRRLVNERFYRN